MKTENKIPSWLLGRTFVVFNFGTTGLYCERDKIIEIGAVKIEDGKITKKFSSFVNPQISIPKEITKITGITQKDVKTAPVFNEIVADFYNFTYGSALVSHNIDFDLNFLRFNTKDSNYIFSNRTYDTLPLARKFFLLSENKENCPANFKIMTVAEQMGIDCNNKCSAINDSMIIAKIFLKIMSHASFAEEQFISIK